MLSRDRDFFFPRLGFGSRMLGFRDPFEDFFTRTWDDPYSRLGSLWSDFGTLTPHAEFQCIAPVGLENLNELPERGEASPLNRTESAATKESKMDLDESSQHTTTTSKTEPAGAKTTDARSLTTTSEGIQNNNRSMVRSTGSDWLQSYLRAPQVDVIQRDNEFQVKVDIPGVRKEDVKVNITEDARGRKMLNISGERKEDDVQEDKEKGFRSTSRRYGKFSRSLLLPDGVVLDGIKAKQDNGVLSISVPKQPVQPKKSTAMDVNIE